MHIVIILYFIFSYPTRQWGVGSCGERKVRWRNKLLDTIPAYTSCFISNIFHKKIIIFYSYCFDIVLFVCIYNHSERCTSRGKGSWTLQAGVGPSRQQGRAEETVWASSSSQRQMSPSSYKSASTTSHSAVRERPLKTKHFVETTNKRDRSGLWMSVYSCDCNRRSSGCGRAQQAAGTQSGSVPPPFQSLLLLLFYFPLLCLLSVISHLLFLFSATIRGTTSPRPAFIYMLRLM